MKRIKFFTFALLVLCLASFSGFAQSNIVKNDLSQTEIDNIIKKMTENEEALRISLSNYVFNRKYVVQTIGLGGQVTGTYRRDSFITFTDDGKRYEKITYSPMPTTYHAFVTIEDETDIGGVNSFALMPSQINLYNFTYLGKERIDELNLHVFDVAPKVMPDPKKSDLRLFQGRIWIDDRDLMLVKSKGKGVPEGKDKKGLDQRFPTVEIWRENVDGIHWFPSYASSDDELVFSSGNVQKIKLRVKFSDYKKTRTGVVILDDVEPIEPPAEEKPAGDAPPPLPKKPEEDTPPS